MKTTVIYHRADFDGIFCREIARKFLPADTAFIGWDYGDAKIDPLTLAEGIIYILDLSPECLEGTENGVVLLRDRDLIWIDHHKSAIEKFSETIPGYRIDGVAACRLAYQWFRITAMSSPLLLPGKQEFINREVLEPLAVRLAGEYDIWDKRDPNAELFQHGLRSRELTDITWNYLLNNNHAGEECVFDLLDSGRAIQYSQTRSNESVIREIGFTFQWEGLTFLGCNASRYNSHLFAAGLRPEHDGCFGFKWTGKEWSVSLYGVPGKPDVDLSQIAVKHGGGGHKQACGFRAKTLPFLKDMETYTIGLAGSPTV
jgi:oligoribonuclease NrnB/cAMP/cGMP phosphodiesterase (DHH superfamily)